MSVAKRTDLSAGEPPSAAWHALAAAEVLAVLESREAGLTEAEAQFRLASVGPNLLPQQPPPTVWQIFLRQFRSPLIYLLLAATMVSLVIGHFDDAVFIAAVLLINAVIGTIQEWKAEQSSRALQKLLRIRATVVRDGEVKEIPADQVVPGDIVWLEPGNRVPADVRLLWSHALEIDESLLTGESLGVLKDHEWSGPPATPVADRLNMAHAGTLVIRGRGKGIVVATGSRTVVGQLALDVMAAPPGKPPLIERMERFAHAIAGTVLAAVAVVALIGVLVHGHGLTETFTFAVALAVSAVPEGLPVALTVALAVATNRMARRGVIVRRLAAVEGLGSATLIASDKTGTLTCNELTVRQIRVASGAVFEVTGEGFTPHGQVLLDGKPVEPGTHPELNRLARAAVLCNEAELHLQDSKWTWRGDPTDVALLSMAHKLGWNRELTLDRHPQVNEIPFEPEHRFAASYHQMEDGSVYVFVKGAPERVLAMCNWADESDRQRQLALASEMASQGYRVLALAEGPAPAHLDTRQTPPEPTGLTLLGFVGMIDPLRPGVREAVASCHAAGITVCMVTGDHRLPHWRLPAIWVWPASPIRSLQAGNWRP
jgi:Ca2+-transporting ATPase